MKDREEIKELIENSKRGELNVDIKKDNKYEEVTKKLEEEEIKDYEDFSDQSMKILNISDELKEFDYLEEVLPDAGVNEPKKPIKQQDEFEKKRIKARKTLKNPVLKQKQSSKNNYHSKKVNGKKPIICFKNVTLQYDTEKAIKGISLDIYPQDFVYFVGASGAGKTSLAKMIYREVNATDGNLFVDGEDITNFKSSQVVKLRRKVGVIFQDFKLLKDKTVYENVRYTLEVTNASRHTRNEKVLKTLRQVGIIDQKDKYPDELSGGQQQRVAIARAIVDEPKIIVADEPTGNLDPQNALAIMDILQKINEMGTTVVMATHDVGIVNKFQKRVILFKNGHIENEATGEYLYE